MSTVATPTREQVESVVRNILRKHATLPAGTNGRAQARPRVPSWS